MRFVGAERKRAQTRHASTSSAPSAAARIAHPETPPPFDGAFAVVFGAGAVAPGWAVPPAAGVSVVVPGDAGAAVVVAGGTPVDGAAAPPAGAPVAVAGGVVGMVGVLVAVPAARAPAGEIASAPAASAAARERRPVTPRMVVAPSEQIAECGERGGEHGVPGRARVEHHEPAGLGFGQLLVGGGDLREEGAGLALQAVGQLPDRIQAGARQLRIEGQQQRAVGRTPAVAKSLSPRTCSIPSPRPAPW